MRGGRERERERERKEGRKRLGVGVCLLFRLRSISGRIPQDSSLGNTLSKREGI
jgi:hypothetical protein